MHESTTHHRNGWILLAALLAIACPPARAARVELGQYGGDLGFLRQFYTAPQSRGENNHSFDLWSGSLPALARVNGLTNNHALFVDSHGKAGCAQTGSGYGLYPKEDLLKPGQRMSYYSARDLATVMGDEAAAGIHNVVIAGCNEEGRFNSLDFRRAFPNATNITYMAAGQLAYKPMFYQAIVLPSAAIKPFFGVARQRAGRVECSIVDESAPGAKALGQYVADLFLPGAEKPFRKQIAGRELLDPTLGHAVGESTGVLLPGARVSARSSAETIREQASVVRSIAPVTRVAPIIIVAERKPAPAVALSTWERVRQTALSWWESKSFR